MTSEQNIGRILVKSITIYRLSLYGLRAI